MALWPHRAAETEVRNLLHFQLLTLQRAAWAVNYVVVVAAGVEHAFSVYLLVSARAKGTLALIMEDAQTTRPTSKHTVNPTARVGTRIADRWTRRS
jgi:hypothetical protein